MLKKNGALRKGFKTVMFGLLLYCFKCNPVVTLSHQVQQTENNEKKTNRSGNERRFPYD